MDHKLQQMAVIEIARFLDTNLPTNESDWWKKYVLDYLSFNQQRNAREKGFCKLQQLDFAALLLILDKNWKELRGKAGLPWEAWSWVKELREVRNKWAHLSAEPIPARQTHRDIETLGLLLAALGAAPETLQILDKARAAAAAEMVGTGTTITIPAPMVVWLPQLLNSLSEDEFDNFISGLDETWCAQELFRGKRLLIFKDASGVFAEESYGKRYEIPVPILEAVKQLSGNCILDGVADKNIFYTYDLLKRGDEDCRPKPYGDRYKNLETIVGTKNTGAVRIVPTVIGKSATYKRYEELKKRDAEGIVYKDLCAKHEAGDNHQTQFKFKFYAHCSAVVIRHNDKRSVALALYLDDGSGSGMAIGNVTIPANYEIPAVGNVVEVAYLYYFPGGSLHQPVYQGVRTDIPATDCSFAKQKLKYKKNDRDAAHTAGEPAVDGTHPVYTCSCIVEKRLSGNRIQLGLVYVEYTDPEETCASIPIMHPHYYWCTVGILKIPPTEHLPGIEKTIVVQYQYAVFTKEAYDPQIELKDLKYIGLSDAKKTDCTVEKQKIKFKNQLPPRMHPDFLPDN